MVTGREITGLPVFSWNEGVFLGRAQQCYLDISKGVLGGIILEKPNFKREKTYINAEEILKIYRDGIIAKSTDSTVKAKSLPQDTILYTEFLQRADLVYDEGEVVSDLFFDETMAMVGGEISQGFWHDLSYGRSFSPWHELCNKIKLQKNGR